MTLLELWKTLDKLPETILKNTNAIVYTSEGEFEVENVEYKDNKVKGLKWHDREDYPEKDKWIIVKDKDGREFKYHQWSGYCYYAYILHTDGCCDGWRSDIDIVAWRYDYSI